MQVVIEALDTHVGLVVDLGDLEGRKSGHRSG